MSPLAVFDFFPLSNNHRTSFLFVHFLSMIPRRALERLCKSDVITQSQSDTVYALFKAVAGHRFSNLSTSIFQHADQGGRDTILRALGHSAAHLELDKVFCSLDDEDVTDIFNNLAVIKFERQKENADGDVRRAQEFLFSPPGSSLDYEGYSPTPDPAEMRTAKWISDQSTLPSNCHKPSEHVNNRTRRHSEIASDECDSSRMGDALPEIAAQEKVGVRRQANRSCKSTRASQSPMRDGKPDLRARGISRSTARSGNIGLRGMCSDKEPMKLKDKT